jgi:glycosyltransferase involved in cell wall biosynthesis
MHIGLLTADLTHRHGWAHYSLSLIEALQRAGVQVSAVAARNSPPVEGIHAQMLLPSVDPYERGMLAKMLLAASPTATALRGCDVIHAAIEPYAPVAALIAGNRPQLVTGHGSYVRISRERRWPVSAIYAWAFQRGTMVCVSQYTASAVEEVLPNVRTEVVSNGIDVERFADLRHVAHEGPTVLTVGAVKPRKGTLALVQAMPAIREQLPDARLVIIGSLEMDPDYVARVREEIEALGLQESVRLLGRVPDHMLMSWYAAADVFALPSLNVGWKFEGFGLALLEASAAGLPVVSTTDCGAEDAVDDSMTGLLVAQDGLPDGDTRALSAAILRLLTNPTLAAQMGAAGRERALRTTWDATAAEMIALYERLLRGEPAPAAS